jgi:VIT1/CCC1 family predicted Fe2+/Mn2+ transporter
MGFLKGKKTYVTAALAVIGAVAAYSTGDATAMQAIQMGFTALLAACLRHGMS